MEIARCGRREANFKLSFTNQVAVPQDDSEGKTDRGQSGQSMRDKFAFTRLFNFPDEVFSIIFEFYASSLSNNDPWILMQVCRRWRTLATDTRRIWSGILLAHVTNHISRRYGGYEVCHTEHLLRDALARSAGGPLDLWFEFGQLEDVDSYGVDNTVAENAAMDTIARTLIEVLRAAEAYLRIRSLYILTTV
ncbi:hypothetical protein FRC16_000340 [Serendipita sp. 398]|nr:hypothetical protein FRC16_000340 [Serendipita sp. 398]